MMFFHMRHFRRYKVRNTMSNTPPAGQWPSYPAYQPNQPYPAYQPYQPYPAYQPYSSYPQSYLPQPYPAYQPVQPAPDTQPDEGPLAEMPQGYTPGRYASIFAIVLGVVCLGALVLATLAPALAPQSQATVPSNWGKVYDGAIRADGMWDTANSNCNTVSNGLDIQALDVNHGVSCDYIPSERQDLLRHGFYIQAEIAPAARVAGNQLPAIVAGQGDDIVAAFDQEGNYEICARTSVGCRNDSTVAWHSNAYVANTIGLLYVPFSSDTFVSGTFTLFANGQAITSIAGPVSTNSPLALGAGQGGEALFTHVTLYLASAS